MSCCESPFVGLLGIVFAFAFDLLQIHDAVYIFWPYIRALSWSELLVLHTSEQHAQSAGLHLTFRLANDYEHVWTLLSLMMWSPHCMCLHSVKRWFAWSRSGWLVKHCVQDRS